MDEQYTPSTSAIKARYSIGDGSHSDATEDARDDAFDRWLTAHDREVAEKAWDECVARVVPQGFTPLGHLDNPFRQSIEGEQR